MVENFKRTAVAAAALFVLLFTGCPNNAGGGGGSTVNITVKKVQGEGHVTTLPSDPVSVPLGSSWSSVKMFLRSKIGFAAGFTLNSAHPEEDASTQEFTDGYIFYEDATVFIKSRKDLPDISTIQGPGTQIKITLAVDPERGQILGPAVISVNSGTTWAQLEAYAKAALKANYGFKEEGAEWKNGSTVLGSTDSFGTDATLTAYPKDIRIRIKVTGDTNVTIDNPDEPIIAIPGSKWKEIKAKADGKVRVKDKTRYAVTAWHKGTDASGSKLTDGYEFQESDRPDCTVFAKTGDRQITLTVKYGTGSGTPSSGGTITIYDGDTWASVKAQAEGKVIVPQDHIIREWRLNGKSGQVINDSYTFKASDGNAQTVYAKLQNQKIKVTVKYGTGSGTPTSGGFIIVSNGASWSSIKAQAEAKVPQAEGVSIQAWHWNTKDGQVINDGDTFNADKGNERTVYAELKDSRIKITVKYGKVGTSSPPTAGSITVYDGDRWSEIENDPSTFTRVVIPKVQKDAEKKVPASELTSAVISQWCWSNADGEVIPPGYTFKVSDGRERTVFALIRPQIDSHVDHINKVMRLRYYTSVSGTVNTNYYNLKLIEKVTGGTVGQSGCGNNGPHTISLDAYNIGQIEVTQALYELVMGKNPSHFNGSSGYQPDGDEKQALRPVENVNWYYAVAFCNELTRCTEGLGKDECVYTYNGHTYTVSNAGVDSLPEMNMDKKGFRLPTEAEWEWAAQWGSSQRKYAGTDAEINLGVFAWFSVNGNSKTHEVQKKSPNGFDLYDMSGNVGEWCWDWYTSYTPADGTNPTGASNSTSMPSTRIIRGGSFNNDKDYCRCAYRNWEAQPNYPSKNVGFRIVCRP